MRLDLRNKAQLDLCKRAIITLDGVQQTTCHIADSDQGFVEVAVGTRQVGVVRKTTLERRTGQVIITIDGRVR